MIPTHLTEEQIKKILERDRCLVVAGIAYLVVDGKILLFSTSTLPSKQILPPQSDESLHTMGARAYKQLQRRKNES